MTVNTITQPPFIVDTEVEKSTSWPEGAIVFVRATNMLYYLKSGVYYNLVDTLSNSIPRTWINGVRKTLVKQFLATGTVAGGAGNVTFNLTDDGTATGNAIFTNVYQESANFWINSQISFNFSSYTLSGDKKTLTVKVSNPIISALIIVYANAANGTVAYLQINGD